MTSRSLTLARRRRILRAVKPAHAIPVKLSAGRYLELARCGILSPDDHIELLDGMVVATAAQTAWHAGTVALVQRVLQERLGFDVLVRTQSSFVAGPRSVPEPDIAVVPGRAGDYFAKHPSTALLVVEVAHTTLAPDRLTKAALYAKARVPCYWIVNLRDHCVEEYREPDDRRGTYRRIRAATGPDQLAIDAFPGVTFRADELLPPADVEHD